MTIATYIIGYITLCIAVAVVIIFANFITAIVMLGFAIAAVVAVLLSPTKVSTCRQLRPNPEQAS